MSEMTRINLDNSAGASNPSALHQAGQEAKRALETARKQVAALINAKPDEISFTSCGTESNNWAIRGIAQAYKTKGRHLILSAIEHPSISLAVRRLTLEGWDATSLPVDHEGRVSPADLKAALKPDTVLVSVMLANGEVGTVQPIAELAAVAHEHGALLHTDAIAAAGHWPIDVKALGVDALSVAANQFYGPPGAAALYLRDGVRILPLLEGGGQEQGGRSGTENVPAIAGMGAAAESSVKTLMARMTRQAALRDRLRDGLTSKIEHVRINGSWSARLPHNLHICVDGVTSEALVAELDRAGVAAGLGSACNSKAMRPSHVLKAMGLSDEQAKGALVLTVGDATTTAEIDQALSIIPAVVKQLRAVTALTSRA